MKNKLLITTALVAAFSVTDVLAKTIDSLPSASAGLIIGDYDDGTGQYLESSDKSYLSEDEITIRNIDIHTQYGIDVGSNQTNNNSALTKSLTINSDARVDSLSLNVTEGGVVHLSDKGEIHAGGAIKITGGTVTLSGGEFMSEGNSAAMEISGGKIEMTSTNNSFNGLGMDISGNDSYPGEETSVGPITMTGGEIVVTGPATPANINGKLIGNHIAAQSFNMSGGTLTINENSGLAISKGSQDESETKFTLIKSTANLTDNGVINLSGKLIADISGNGNLNVKTSSASVDGNVSGSNLTFEADHSLSKAISGTIGDLASLNVNNGTLTYDKKTGKIGNLNIAGNLNVAEDLWTQNGFEIIEGSIINLQGKSLNSRAGGIDITGGTVNMNNGSNDPDLTLWAAKDINISGGTINMNGDNASIDTFYDLLDSNGTLLPKPEVPGNINITGGTINVNSSSAEISSEGQVNVAGNAILNIADGAELSSFKNWTYVDDDIEMGDKATINLIDNGTINLSGKLVSDISGNGNLNVKTSSASVDGNVSGSNLTFEADHSLSKAISGTIGDLASLNVNNGTLTYDKQTGKIGSLNVAGGLDIGTNTVNAANVNFADNSTLGLKVASADNYGQIKADTINIGNDTTMKITLDSGVVANGESKNFDFLQGSVTGDFTNKIADNNRYNISFEDGSFKITGTATASDVVSDAGGSANNAKTAEAWDSITSSATASSGAKAVASVLSNLSQNATTAAGQKAYVDALTAIAPEAAPAVQSASTETTNQVFGAVGARLSGGSVSTGGEGMSSGDNIFERAAVWVQTLFNKSKLDDTSKSKGFDADTNGIAFGAEKFVNDDVKVGVGYAYSQTDIDGFMRSTDVDTHTAIVYGEYKPSNWYVNGIATYGWSDYSENKSVAGVGVKADYDVETFGLQAMSGYDMNIKGFGVTPEAGLRYVHIKQDAYKDSADQKISGNDSDILTGVIGAKVSKNWELENGMNIRPEARVAATYDLMKDDVNSVVTLANGSAYAVEGKALDRFGMEFGAGVTAEVNDNVELSLGYEGKFRQDYQDHTGLLNAKYKF
ncbi:MAG: autotransporter domain-containing protein [Alphaproteobacteria bacterium]